MSVTDRMDLISPKEVTGGKTIYRKVGAAWPRQNGPGWSLELEMIPLPDKEGRIRIMMLPPRGDNAQAAPGANQYAAQKPRVVPGEKANDGWGQ